MAEVVQLYPRKTGLSSFKQISHPLDADIAKFRQKLDERNAISVTVTQRDGLMAMFRRLNNEANQITGTLNVIGVSSEHSKRLHADIYAIKSLILGLATSENIHSM